jgi:hypothetical protein
VPDEFIADIGSTVGRPIECYSCFISYSRLDQEGRRGGDSGLLWTTSQGCQAFCHIHGGLWPLPALLLGFISPLEVFQNNRVRPSTHVSLTAGAHPLAGEW